MPPAESDQPAPPAPVRGRRPATSRAEITDAAIELFIARGFEETSVDDIAAAVGIARRTLFRYYPSKNAIPWGEFDARLNEMRALFAELDDNQPISVALTRALVEFNKVPDQHLDNHRRRMTLLLRVPALQAHSMLMYADWRQVIAEFCARRLGVADNDHQPQTIAWACLGIALAAYDQWLANPQTDLAHLLTDGCQLLDNGVH